MSLKTELLYISTVKNGSLMISIFGGICHADIISPLMKRSPLMNNHEFRHLYKTVADNNYDGQSSSHFGFWAQQNFNDLVVVMEAASAINPQRILEIGVNHGGCLVFWDHLAGPNGLTVGMDDGGTIDTQIFSMFRSRHCRYNPVSELHIIQGNSHRPESFQLVTELFDGTLDLLFIDGDHTYEGALQDYHMYGPLVRPGGMIVVDDVNMGDERVTRAWNDMLSLGGEKTMTSTSPYALGIIKISEEEN